MLVILVLKEDMHFSFYDHPDRLKTPLIKRNGKFEEASWDEAYDFIKKRNEQNY